jgi:membrane protein YqaA with SNARE-associated domain
MDLIGILLNTIGNPYLYSIIFFLYVISASIFLPIPVEIGLFNPYIHPALLITILAIGNGCGSLIVFYIGTGVRKTAKKKWTLKSQRIKQLVTSFENFVKKHGAAGLYVFMSIPLMVDTLPLYLFSILNAEEDGKRALSKKKFVLINILAGATRGTIVIVVYYVLKIKLT